MHTLLRLPTGVFARGGVKTNVIFFDAVRPRGDGSPATGRYGSTTSGAASISRPGRDRCVVRS